MNARRSLLSVGLAALVLASAAAAHAWTFRPPARLSTPDVADGRVLLVWTCSATPAALIAAPDTVLPATPAPLVVNGKLTLLGAPSGPRVQPVQARLRPIGDGVSALVLQTDALDLLDSAARATSSGVTRYSFTFPGVAAGREWVFDVTGLQDQMAVFRPTCVRPAPR